MTTEVPGSDKIMIGVSLDRPDGPGCGSAVVATTSIVSEVPGSGSSRSIRFTVGMDWGVSEGMSPVLVETTTGMLSGCDEASLVLELSSPVTVN